MSNSKINFTKIKSLRWFFSLLLISIACLSFSQTTPAMPGDLDPMFGINGVVLTNFDNNDATKEIATDTAVQADGKVVVVGYICTGNYCNVGYVTLTRYNPNGLVDTSFGVGGRVELRDFVSHVLSPDVLIQPDGKIVVSANVNGRRSRDFALARFNSDGTLDSTFGTNGKVTIDFDGNNNDAYSLAIQPDGKIVVAGTSNNIFALARCNTDGSLDTSFGLGGKVLTDRVYPYLGNYYYTYNTFVISDLIIQPDGNILACGQLSLPLGNIVVVRYTPNGSLDMRFGAHGVTTVIPGYFGSAEFEIYSAAIQPDGKIVVGGTRRFYSGGTPDFLIVRYNTDGLLDTSFDDDGMVISDSYGWQSGNDIALSLSIQSDGKILAAGRSGGGNIAAIARYNANGSIDKSFNFDGRVLSNKLNIINSITLLPNGNILAAGYKDSNSAIARFEGGSLPSKTAFDFDGDNKSDLALWRPSNQTWYILRSSDNGMSEIQWGVSTDILAPADYDGDGKTDIAILRPQIFGPYGVMGSGFYILQSSNNLLSTIVIGLAVAPEQLIVGDYDGDGKADPAIFIYDYDGNGAAYLIIRYLWSSNNQLGLIRNPTWASSSTPPLPQGLSVNGDFNGDGITDISSFSPERATWNLYLSTSLEVKSQIYGNQVGDDKPMPADYDGDGKTDLAVYSNGEWQILQSSDNSTRVELLGNSTDVPAPADYDGDGKTDIAVYRKGEWWIKLSSSGDVLVKQFGLAGDVPIPSAHLR